MPGLNGVSVMVMGRFRGREAVIILLLYMGPLVRERTNRRRTVVRFIHLNNASKGCPQKITSVNTCHAQKIC